MSFKVVDRLCEKESVTLIYICFYVVHNFQRKKKLFLSERKLMFNLVGIYTREKFHI